MEGLKTKKGHLEISLLENLLRRVEEDNETLTSSVSVKNSNKV